MQELQETPIISCGDRTRNLLTLLHTVTTELLRI